MLGAKLSPSRIHLPCSVLGSGAGPASEALSIAYHVLHHLLHDPQKYFLCMSGLGVGLREFICRGWTFCLFLFPVPSWSPLTMPNIPISEVDALPESDQTLSSTGTCMVWRILRFGANCVKTDVMNVAYCYLFFGNIKFTWFEIQNLLRKRIQSFPHLIHLLIFPSSEAIWRLSSQDILCKHKGTQQQSLMFGCHFFLSLSISGSILHIPFLLVCLEDCSIQTQKEPLQSLQLCSISLYE